MQTIYLVRQHLQVGDELILTATIDRECAERQADARNKASGTVNFDVIEVEDGRRRNDL